MFDPRPDLVEDSELWKRVLVEADATDLEVYSILHGFRCAGAQIVRSGHGIQLRPRIDPSGSTSVWTTSEDYRADRERWLVPLRDQLTTVFRNAAQWITAA
jgi:hypothetical protein